jgi:hypothetical protein
VADGKVSDKATWDKASEGIHCGTVRGAVAGAKEWPEGRLDEVTVEWASQPKFLADGTVESDSEEPGIPPVKVTTRYVWQEPAPKLPPSKT